MAYRRKDKIKIEKAAKDIALKDDTFKFKITPCKDKSKADFILRIYHSSQDKQKAHQRGTWFIHNVGGEFYWVK